MLTSSKTHPCARPEGEEEPFCRVPGISHLCTQGSGSGCDPTHVTRIILQPPIRSEAFNILSKDLRVTMDNPRIDSNGCLK